MSAHVSYVKYKLVASLKKRNQTRFELSSDIFKIFLSIKILSPFVSPLMTCKEIHIFMRESCILWFWIVGSYVVKLDNPNLSGFTNMLFPWKYLISLLDSFSKTFIRLLGPSWQLTMYCHQQNLLHIHLW